MSDVGLQLQDMPRRRSQSIETERRAEMERLNTQIRDLTTRLERLEILPPPVENARAVSHANLKPPTFNGETSWDTYLIQFEAAARANNWDTAEKASALIISLKDSALNVLTTIPEQERQDYDILTSALELRFGAKHLQQLHQSQLSKRCQKPGESLQEFEVDVNRLVRLAYVGASGELYDQLATDKFIAGINDKETQLSVRLGRHKSSADALIHAIEFEAAKQASHSTERTCVRVAGVEEPLSAVINQLTTLSEKVDIVTRQVNTAKPVCWGCGGSGHIRANCPSRGERNGYRSYPSQRYVERRDYPSATMPPPDARRLPEGRGPWNVNPGN